MCAKVCLKVDFELKIYQSKRKEINFAMYQSKNNNFYNVIRKDFTMYQSKCYNISEKISHCIRANIREAFTLYQIKFYHVSEQVKRNFRVYQSKSNFLRCIKVNKISKDVSEQV